MFNNIEVVIGLRDGIFSLPNVFTVTDIESIHRFVLVRLDFELVAALGP